VATVDLSGNVNTLIPGFTEISANLDGITGMTGLIVRAAAVSRLQILPGDFDVPQGTLQRLSVSAFFTDGSVVDVTADSAWTSSDYAVAFVFNAGQAAGSVLGRTQSTAVITASYQGVNAAVTATVSDAILQSIKVDPSVLSTPAGLTVEYIATGIYSDASGVDLTDQVSWQSSDLAVASVSAGGLVSALAPGPAEISATFNDVTGVAALTVSSAVIQSIDITPASVSAGPGVEQALTATALYTDNTVEDVTLTANWSSSNNAVATVDTAGADAGVVKLLSEGQATITAQLAEQSATAAITVTPAVLQSIDVTPLNKTVAAGVPVSYRAVGLYSDNSTVDLTFSASWQSSDPAVSTITESGLALTQLAGVTEISASYEGVTGTASLTVDEPLLLRLSVIPVALVKPVGTSGQLKAIALYSDLTTADVTAAAIWSSTDEQTIAVVASGENAGFAELRQIGSAFVMADFGGVSTNIPVEVTAAVLVDIQLDPQSRSIANGLTVQYTAYGLFSDGSSSPINSDVAWTSSNAGIASITQEGLAQAVSVGTASIRATLGTFFGESSLIVTDAEVQSLQITPADLTKPAGTSGQFTATAFYSDNTSEDVSGNATWGSSDPSVVVVSNSAEDGGLANLLAEGTAEITASFESSSDTVTIKVAAAVLIAIEVTPASSEVASGGEVRYSAVGIFSDGTTYPLDDDVSWNSSDTAVATIDLNGVALTNDVGSTVITAAFNAIQGNASLTVSAATPVALTVTPAGLTEPAGTSIRFTATLVLSNGSQGDVSTVATWSSSDDTIVDVVTTGTDGGLAELLAQGQAQVTVNYQGLSDTVSVTVTDAVLQSISVSPTNATIVEGTEIDYSATGNYSDGSATPIDGDVVWKSDDTSIATVTAAGLAKGVLEGSTNITASLDTVVGSAAITVSPAEVISLSVSPPFAELLEDTTRDFTATAVFTNGNSQDVTTDAEWTVTDSAVATVSNAAGSSGRVTALTIGATDAQAAFGGETTQADIAVVAPVIISVEITAQNNSVPAGTTSNWGASATLSDGDTIDVTEDVAWYSGDNLIATVEGGLVAGIAIGSASIYIQYDTFFDVEPVSVVAPLVDDLIITPSLASLVPDGIQAFLAIAQFSDGTNSIVTESVDWSTDDITVAVISNVQGEKGVATGVAAGTATVSALLNGVSYNGAVIEVEELQLVDLRIEPPVAEVAEDTSIFFKAIGVLSDSSERDITVDVSWYSSDGEVVFISNEEGQEGVATALKKDESATIIATISTGDGISDRLTATATVDTTKDCGGGNPDSVRFVPAQSTVSVGTEGQAYLYATYGACEQDMTGKDGLIIESQDKDIVVMVEGNGKDGKFVGVAVGMTQLEGKYKGETALGDVEVIEE
jgi:hypothetical protein